MDTLAAPDVLGQMRPVLMKFAQMRLRNQTWAEDVVSEATLAALERASSFEARSQFQTWVIGILKHKIIDMQRRLQREISIDAIDEIGERDDFDSLLQRDPTQLAASESTDPESVVAERQFVRLTQRCIDRLPAIPARAFVMHEWFEYSTDEVCAALSISRTNCNVMMFRVRSQLRKSLRISDNHDSMTRCSSATAPRSEPAAAAA